MTLLRRISTVALLLVLMPPGLSSAEKETKSEQAAKKEKIAKQKAETKAEPKDEPEQDYWMTVDKMGVRYRHNSKCRFYHSDKGRPCSKGEGRPCRSCGG